VLKLFGVHRRWHVIPNEEHGVERVVQQLHFPLAILMEKNQKHLLLRDVIYWKHQAWEFVLL
jgi:hypothetical protein